MVDANDIGRQDLIEVESPWRDPVFIAARDSRADVAGQPIVEAVVSQNPAGTGDIESDLIVDAHLSAVYSSKSDRAILVLYTAIHIYLFLYMFRHMYDIFLVE